MPLNKNFLTSLIAAISLGFILLVLITVSAQAQPYILEVKIGDIALAGTQSDVRIPVYLKNLTDSVGAFDFLLINDRPDLVTLKDTIISEGCLIEDWEIVNSQLTSDTLIYAVQLRLFGIADWISNIEEQPALYYPQTGEIPLFYILADITLKSDSTIARATLSFLVDQPGDFIVSDEVGYTIGTRLVELVDTVYYACETWYGETCLTWVEVAGPPADSIEYWPYNQAWIDSSVTSIRSGLIDIGWHLCGDFSGSDGKVNLADITSMISYVYLDGPPPDLLWAANVDGSPEGKINLADITRLIDHVYVSRRPLDCFIP